MRKLAAVLLALTSMLAVGFATAAAAPARYVNDFEQPGDDTPARSWNNFGVGTIHRVPSGYVSPSGYASGIESAHGDWHARLRNAGCEAVRFTGGCTGPFTRWGKPTSANPVFPPGGYTTEVDIYLDVAWATGKVDYRFDWSSAINNTTGNFQRDFVFNAGTPLTAAEATTAPGFYVNASTNATRGSSFPQNPCPAPMTPPNSCRTPVKITESGWYTFTHRFYPSDFEGTDYLAVDMTIDRQGNEVADWTISVVPVDNMAIIGGDRYGWFANNEINDLAIDCSVLRLADGDGKKDKKDKKDKDKKDKKDRKGCGNDRGSDGPGNDDD